MDNNKLPLNKIYLILRNAALFCKILHIHVRRCKLHFKNNSATIVTLHDLMFTSPNIKNMTQAYDGNNPLSYKQTDNKLMEALHNLEH